MRVAHVTVQGIGMLSGGRAFEGEVEKPKKGHELEWEKKNFWRRMHYQKQATGEGQILAPALCCKKSLDEAVRDGSIQPGHLVCLPVFGGGLTWGSAMIRW